MILHRQYQHSPSSVIPNVSETSSVSRFRVNYIGYTFITTTLITLVPIVSSLSIDPIKPINNPTPSPQQTTFPFQRFSFAPNGVCINPSAFFCDNHVNSNETNRKKDSNKINNNNEVSAQSASVNESLEFTMRNVPGDGDCMFLAVALATSTSMGLGANNALLNAVADETRDVVAQILSTPKGHLHVNGKRIVNVRSLLKSAAASENVSIEKYIELLRNGNLQGGGPELTVLSNVLRRPISIYELDDDFCDLDDIESDNNNGNISMEDNVSSSSSPISSRCKIKCVGTFGDLFKDPCSEIPNPAVISGLLPGAYSWHIHLLVLDSGPNEKHACALLPKYCYV